MTIMSVIVIVSALVIGIIGLSYIKEEHNRSRGGLTGNNDIDRLIQEVYENDKFVDKSDLNLQNSYDDNRVDVAIDILLTSVEYNDKLYLKEDVYIEERYIKEKIKDVKGYLSDNNREIELELYSIKGVSNEVAIAVKAVDSDKKYLLLNGDYEPKTLEDFIEDLGLRDGATVLEIRLLDYKDRYSVSYEGVSMEYLMDGLLANSDKKIINEQESKIEETGLQIVISVDSTREKYLITVFENGDLNIKSILYYTRCTFNGDENTFVNGLELINYLRDNYKGVLTKY